jgi:hypothetical protein
MSGSKCVTEMVYHMKDEVERVLKGTPYEGKEFFFHDALSLTTCTNMKKYMLDNDLPKYWLLPLEGLQGDIRYKNSIPGDSPEMMPLDETLNQDIHISALYHVAMTSHLENDDPINFSFATPKQITRAYLRLVHPDTGDAPSSKQIIEDCEKWMRILEIIREEGGNIVEEFGRNGHRHPSQGKHGGFHTQKPQGPEKWGHKYAEGLSQQQWRNSVQTVNNKLEIMKTPGARKKSNHHMPCLYVMLVLSPLLSFEKNRTLFNPHDKNSIQYTFHVT